ncbi:MAG TPA: c-type cytochrome [Gemmatimonadaceae bacterium]|nr:c-type cytochrome [Gemmatimonadaceae bacterium]
MTFWHPRIGALLVAAAAACGRPSTHRPAAGGQAFDPLAWRPPADSEIPADSVGASIRRGLALVMHTPDSLPRYAPGNISCSNCHLAGGRNPDAAPLTGSHARFPKYLERTGAVIGLADRVNYCFTRSLAGNRLPPDSREMQDILAYIAWLSRGVPVGAGSALPGANGISAMTVSLEGNAERGRQVYAAKCVACHQLDGQGMRAAGVSFPALWGSRSFSVGASMARQTKAASFIWHNMPLGAGKSLTPQQAFDVAAYVTSQARPDSPGKGRDWPSGGAPADVPYATQGHAAFLPPPVLPRANPSRALVDVPRSANVSGRQ